MKGLAFRKLQSILPHSSISTISFIQPFHDYRDVIYDQPYSISHF